MGAKQEAQEWAETVRRYGERHGLTYEQVGGINPKDGAGGALRRRRQPPHRAARRGLLGLVLRRRRKGSRRLLQQGGAADRDPRQGPHARPGEGRPRLQRRVDRGRTRHVTQRFSRKVEFESIDFNRRFWATVPKEYDPVALRELFSPGFLGWVTTMSGEIDFGVNDRQLWFLWRLRRAQRGRTESGAEERRPAVPAAAGGDGRERHPHLPARPLARRAGAVPRRAQPAPGSKSSRQRG